MRVTDSGFLTKSIVWIAPLVLSIVVDTAAANDELVAQTGNLRGVVKIEGDVPKVPPRKIQPKRMLVIPRNQEDRDRNQREIDTSPVVEIPDESLVVGENGGVAQVAVYLQQAPAGWTPTPQPLRPLVLEGLAYRFAPHMSLIRVGQSLTLKSSTNSGDYFQFSPQHSPAVSRNVHPNSEVTIEVPFQKRERTPVHVDHPIHGWKQAWVLPLEHPFAAITDQDGRFDISGLQPGEHLFHVWHERTGWLEKKLAVRIAAGKTAELTLKYPAERFEIKIAAANPPKPADPIVKLRDEWGEERDGLRTRLVLVTEKPRLGEPLIVRLEMKNFGDQRQEYDAQQAGVNGSLTVIGPDGKPAPYIDLSYQTSGQLQTIKPGETAVLVEKLDVGTQYLLIKPGRHTVRWTRGGRGFKALGKGPVKAGELPKFETVQTAFVPNSNTLNIDIVDGPLPPSTAIFARIRDLAPNGWNVSQAGGAILFTHSPTGLKADVTTIQLWFTLAPLAADFKLAPGDTQVIDHFEKSPLGHPHLAAPGKAKELWPEYVKTIRSALQAE